MQITIAITRLIIMPISSIVERSLSSLRALSSCGRPFQNY
ncbi:hypothetical protein T01_1178 [Trichinella spiralis]|uniref:Uncharacterized protein n=1 Tax=Trichinella spiralis TaxID=6334 RepID=A0A0V0Z5S1_TRISP|nr:hypothetical protein T01_1178 [Trichinella spiralis]